MDDLNPLAGTAHLLEEVDSKFESRVQFRIPFHPNA